MSPTVWAIGWSGTAAGRGPQPVHNPFFKFFFPADSQLFVGPFGDISIRVLTCICKCLPGIFFFIRCSSIRPFALNRVLNTCQNNLLFIRRIMFSFCHNWYILYGYTNDDDTYKKTNEPGHEKMCLMSYANNKGADQPAHPRSLLSTFIARCLDSIISLDSIAEISRLWLHAASVSAQAGLCLA